MFHPFGCSCLISPFIEQTVIFPIVCFTGSFVLNELVINAWFLSGVSVKLHWFTCLFYANTLALLHSLKSVKVWFLHLRSPFSRLLWLFWVFCGSIHILELFVSISVKNDVAILIEIVFYLFILSSMDILTIFFQFLSEEYLHTDLYLH